jgi:hypothetical protein
MEIMRPPVRQFPNPAENLTAPSFAAFLALNELLNLRA